MKFLKKLRKQHYILLGFLCSIPLFIFAQYKWTVYTGDPMFMTLEDGVDNGRIIYHKAAENSSSLTGNRGVLFDTTFFAFPSLTGSFTWSQVRINIGKISFYPSIFTFENGTSVLSLAILYNISRVSPIRGVRTRPSFTPTSLLQLEKEKMNFSKVKFVSEGFSTDIILQTGNQETELTLSDYDVNYNYWLKSTPNKKESLGLRTFFARPLKSFKIRAYSDKGYLDTTLSGRKISVLGDVFVKSVDLYLRLVDPNYVNTMSKKNDKKEKVSNEKKKPVVKKPAAKRRRRPRRNTQARRKPTTIKKNVVTTNKRPRTTRVVRPR